MLFPIPDPDADGCNHQGLAVDEHEVQDLMRFQFILEIGFVPPAGQWTARAGFGVGFHEHLFPVSGMLQENVKRAAREMKVIDAVDQIRLGQCLC